MSVSVDFHVNIVLFLGENVGFARLENDSENLKER